MADGLQTNLGGLVQRERDLDKTAFIDLSGVGPDTDGQPHRYSHRAMDELANAVARGLRARGLERGNAVAIVAENSVAYFAAYMGILRAGLVAVPVNYKQPLKTIEHILTDSETRLILADADRAGVCPDTYPVISLDGSSADDFAGLLDPGPFEIVSPEPEETAMILYTSGSTGMPKGVLLSHEGQLFALSRWEGDRAELARQRLLIAAPQYHMNALFISKMALYMNATAVLMPRFKADDYIRAISEYAVTWVTSVPTMLALAVREKETLAASDLSSVERLSMGSAPLTEALFDEVQSHFPTANVSNFYGTTEHGPSAFGAHPDGLARPKLSLGYAAPGMELRLVGGPDENTGVLEARSPSNLTGYKNLPEKMAEVVVDGWYHTKDVMTRDENGFYFITGREDDMFVCNGENVFPGDVERLLEMHPDIDQASVVPLEDPVRGHAPIAFVVPVAGHEIDEAAIQHYARENGPAFQFPRSVITLDEMPLAGTNKIDRGMLMQMAAEGNLTAKA